MPILYMLYGEEYFALLDGQRYRITFEDGETTIKECSGWVRLGKRPVRVEKTRVYDTLRGYEKYIPREFKNEIEAKIASLLPNKIDKSEAENYSEGFLDLYYTPIIDRKEIVEFKVTLRYIGRYIDEEVGEPPRFNN